MFRLRDDYALERKQAYKKASLITIKEEYSSDAILTPQLIKSKFIDSK